jgi:hypothetical protein
MPIEQRSLFDDSLAATPTVSLVRAGSAARPLTKNQRQFNRLTARLQELRGELASWQRAVDRYRQRAALELEPLHRELLAEQRAAVLSIDALLARTAKADRLTRGRRRKLCDLVLMLARTVLEAGPDADLEAIFDRHSGVRHRDVRRGDFKLAEAMFDVMFGEDIMAGHTAQNVDELFEQAGERFRAKLEAEPEQQRERPQSRRAQSKRPEAVGEREASQSVRDLFRRLVAVLHPDREADAVARERKTALMQRVNGAYEQNDLLELLTVQIEIEQIDSSHLAQASEQRLGHYCAVLQDQQRALERELALLQAPFLAALDLNLSGCVRPEVLDVLVDREGTDTREALDGLRGDMEALRDPVRRNALLDAIEIDRAENDPLDEILFDASFPPPPSRRGRKKTKRRR